MSAKEPLGIRLATLTLAAIASTTTSLAIADPGQPLARSLTSVAVWVALAAGFHVWLGRRGGRTVTSATTVLLAATFLIPLAGATARVMWLGRVVPLEPALLCALRNLALGLAATAHARSAARLAALASLFLVLASSSIADGPIAAYALGAFAVVGGAWLVLAYWRGLRLTHAEGTPRRSPAGHLAGAFTLIALVVAATAVGPTRTAVALAGLFPSSGGSDWNDPDALGGVGDGDDEVKGAENPESIGFTDSDVYLDSDRPSLYDAFNDMYGEPSKPKTMERMVSLSNENVIEQGEHPVENLRAERQFSAVRRGGDRKSNRARPAHREAGALLYIDGPTPLHIGLSAYDRFDGREWSEAPKPNLRASIELERREGSPWFRLSMFDSLVLGGTVQHKVKIAALNSAVLPAPPLLRAFRMGEVDRSDFFDWAFEGMATVEGRTIPSSTVVQTEAATVVPDLLAKTQFPLRRSAPDDRPLGPSASAWLESLVHATPVDGWSRVEAIVQGLRREAVLDATVVAPVDCSDVVEHFASLRRGPDYLFATTCTMMLQASGHAARLVTGLYAAPSNYDPRTRHTPVSRRDVHAWVEVRLPSGVWIPIEPTPGYELMKPPPTTLASFWATLRRAWSYLAAHPWLMAAVAATTGAAVRFRREAVDLLATMAWRASISGSSRLVVLRTLALVERRAILGGSPRPAGVSLRDWYGPMTLADDDGRDLDGFLALADWSLYAPEGSPPPSRFEEGPNAACRRVVRGWTLGRFRSPRIAIKEST